MKSKGQSNTTQTKYAINNSALDAQVVFNVEWKRRRFGASREIRRVETNAKDTSEVLMGTDMAMLERCRNANEMLRKSDGFTVFKQQSYSNVVAWGPI